MEGVTLPDNVPVTINTLRDVLFMDRVNDISFEIGDKLVVLIEHQSTINPNMALRFLLYVARVYEKIIEKRKIYSTKLFSIPRPEFFVLYNGVAPYPDITTLKLSDAFEQRTDNGFAGKEKFTLDLEVKVININQGKNEEIVKRCKTLASYSAFVGKVHEYECGNIARDEAIKQAIKHCLEHDILTEFFKRHATEVINMLLTEWNMEEAKQVWYEEGVEEGLEKGMEKGMETVARNALAEGAALEFVQKITGLDMETLKNIQAG